MKAYKHRMVIEVTFDRQLTESESHTLLKVGIQKDSINDEMEGYFLGLNTTLRAVTVKRFSRVMAHERRTKP